MSGPDPTIKVFFQSGTKHDAEGERRSQVAELADLDVGDPMVKVYALQKAVRQFIGDTVRLSEDQRAETARDFVLAIVGHLGGLGSIGDLWIEIADQARHRAEAKS